MHITDSLAFPICLRDISNEERLCERGALEPDQERSIKDQVGFGWRRHSCAHHHFNGGGALCARPRGSLSDAFPEGLSDPHWQSFSICCRQTDEPANIHFLFQINHRKKHTILVVDGV